MRTLYHEQRLYYHVKTTAFIGNAQMTKPDTKKDDAVKETATETVTTETPPKAPSAESGGRDGPDPTRYGDWEKNGRCVDF